MKSAVENLPIKPIQFKSSTQYYVGGPNGFSTILNKRTNFLVIMILQTILLRNILITRISTQKIGKLFET